MAAAAVGAAPASDRAVGKGVAATVAVAAGVAVAGTDMGATAVGGLPGSSEHATAITQSSARTNGQARRRRK